MTGRGTRGRNCASFFAFSFSIRFLHSQRAAPHRSDDLELGVFAVVGVMPKILLATVDARHLIFGADVM